MISKYHIADFNEYGILQVIKCNKCGNEFGKTISQHHNKICGHKVLGAKRL